MGMNTLCGEPARCMSITVGSYIMHAPAACTVVPADAYEQADAYALLATYDH